jgi:very-short-patch-repair endonuclease
MELAKYLGIWQLKANGRSIPVGYTALCREVEKLDPDEVGFKVVERLEAEEFISALPNGHRILTDKGLAKRIPLPLCATIQENSSEKNWERFRRLCVYYADCVTQSEKAQEYLFATDLNTKYLLPTLPIGWLGSDEQFKITHSDRQRPSINRIKSRKEDEEDVYIGYPLAAFECANGTTGFSPILLIPVDVTFDINNLKLSIRRDEIDINRSWLEFNVKHEDQKNVLMSMCFAEGEKTGILDVELAVQYINNRFTRKLKTELNPNYLDYEVAGQQRGILNQAVLFVGNPLKYSKSLKKELREISNQPAEMLDKTALAYVFRDPPLENRYEKPPSRLPLDFLKLPTNKEQHDALTQALSFPFSKVTGPPGTGKSQVAVNLIANLAFYEQSALFTSKNHKAIHAIIERAGEVSPDLPLVQFCTTTDGNTGATWARQPIDDVIGRCEFIKHTRGFTDEMPLIRAFEDSLTDWGDWKATVAEIDVTRSKLQDVQAKFERVVPLLPQSIENVSLKYSLRIESLAKKIGLPDAKRGLLQQIIDFVLRRKRQALNAETELRRLLPQLSAKSKGSDTLRNRALRLCGDIADYLAIKDEEATLRDKPVALPEDVEKQLVGGMAFRKEHLYDVLLFRRVKAVLGVTEDTRQKLKDATLRIARQNLPFMSDILSAANIGAAQDAFAQFSKFYPAWASTLLSLTKASPCVAGLFDHVIIDEASQCEIPPIIPALYRAKGATIIGDPKQFPPVITMRETRHGYIRYQKHKLKDLSERFDFMTSNAFEVAGAQPLMLREHFRCHEEIAAYFNETYYAGKLRVRTNAERLKFPANMGFKRAVVWRDVRESLEGELAEVKGLMADLKRNKYEGTVGVISPFRSVADRLKTDLNDFHPMLDAAQDVNTANGFQGGERDLIIFVMGLTGNTSKGERWYVEAAENQYIFNVAVSRARACLIVVGDREQALKSQSGALRKLADIENRRPETLSQSPGEELLFRALCAAGFVPQQQYPLASRYLDMALVNEKIDIEVDGEAYHLNRYGERKQDDIYRDLQVQSNGWRVCRFWYREVRDDVAGCVAKVRELTGT